MGTLIPVQVRGNVGTIEDNLNDVELSIREKVREYSAVVVTEDSVKDGKKFLADIRKEKKSLDDERKAIKSQWMAPYEAFERRVKEIIALYDEPVKIINSQLAEYEEQRRAMKKQQIQEAYDFVKGDIADWLPLERIYNPKWENATCSGKKIREDMELIFDQMKVSISTIRSMKSEFEEDALRVLKETGSLQSAIAEISELQKQKDRFMEKAREEAERELLVKSPADQDVKTMLDPANVMNATDNPVSGQMEEASMAAAPFAMEKTLMVVVKVGENDFGMLKELLEAAGLEYEVKS